MKRSGRGGRSAWIVRRVMEGVQKEFRLAVREKTNERRWGWGGGGNLINISSEGATI